MKTSILAVLVALAASQSACSGFFAPTESRVRAGELFEVAHAKYDPYFQQVHSLQGQVKSWGREKDATRRPLVDALKLDPDVADVTLVQATHERMLGISRDAGNIRVEMTEGRGRVVAQNPAKVDDGGRAVFGAIESCVQSELERAKKLREIPPKADTILKEGRALEPQVREDLGRRGQRAPKQVQEELQASYEVLAELSKSARLRAREAEDFVADLRRAVDSDISDSAARPSSSASKPAKDAKDSKDAKDAKPRSKPDAPAKPYTPPPAKPKADKPDKPEKADKPDKPEKPDKPDPPKPPPKEDFSP